MLNGPMLQIITSIVALFIALVVCMSEGVKRAAKLSFVLVVTSLALWDANIYIADIVHSHLMLWNDAVFLWPTIAAGSSVIFISLLRFQGAKMRPGLLPGSSWFRVLFWVAVMLQAIAIFSNKIFNQVTYNSVTDTYTFSRGGMYLVYIVGIVLVMALMLGRLINNFRKSGRHTQERDALRTVAISIAIVALYSVITNIVIPVVTGSQKYISLGTLSLDIFSFGLAFSIIRYRFLDIQLYVFLGAVYILSLLFVAVMYVVIVEIVALYGLHISLKPGALTVLLVVTLGLAVSFHPLSTFFNKLTRRLFFRGFYEAQDVLGDISDLLAKSVDVQGIKEGVKGILGETIHPSSLEFLLVKNEENNRDYKFLRQLVNSSADIVTVDDVGPHVNQSLINEMKRMGIALAVRLHTSHEDLGFIILGYRKSGAAYSATDKRFLRVVADQVAVGLQNAIRFEEIEKFNIVLQNEVRDATQRLRQTNRRLRALDETKDDFISMASHQLRTPLTSVKGYISLVLDGDAGTIKPNQRKLLTQAFISSQRMVYLIADLLNVSRLKTGKFIIEPSPVNLADIVQDEVDQLVETAQSRSLTLTYHKPAHFPVLQLDETKIRQVAMNFMDNAIYYTPAGGHIEVQLTETPKTVELRIIDDGIGVPKDEQHHLFTKFYRAKNAQRARPDGTGLGLFMAQKVVVAQGGAIIFSSKEGQGSTFGFIFPKAKLQAVATEAAPAA